MGRDKVDKAFHSFIEKFDETNLAVADKEIQDLIQVAQFNTSEQRLFINSIKKFLAEKAVILDSIKFV